MLIRFVCLANSFKEGGRCLAGIELDNNNNPKFENGRPKWVRPICNTIHGEVHTYLVAHVHLLDIVEINVTGYPLEKSHQSENVLFRETSINVLGRFKPHDIEKLCDKRNMIFGSRGKALSEDAIGALPYSLMLVNVDQFEVIEKMYDPKAERMKLRLIFSYKGSEYDLPITDPIFINNYQRNPQLTKDVANAYLCLSLAIAHNDLYYKLVPGIILY